MRTKTRSFPKLLAAATGLLLVLAQSPLLAQDLHGEWRGSGFVRPTIIGPKERIFCKVTGTETGKGRSQLSGRCAATSRSGTLSLQIAETSGRRVAAKARFSGSGETYAYTGRRGASSYVMQSDEPFSVEGGTFDSQFVITFSGTTAMKLTETAVEISSGRKSVVLSISFKKQ